MVREMGAKWSNKLTKNSPPCVQNMRPNKNWTEHIPDWSIDAIHNKESITKGEKLFSDHLNAWEFPKCNNSDFDWSELTDNKRGHFNAEGYLSRPMNANRRKNKMLQTGPPGIRETASA